MASKTKSRGGRSDGYPWDAEMEDKMIEFMGIRIHTTDLRGMRDNKVKYEVVWQPSTEPDDMLTGMLFKVLDTPKDCLRR
jgi:hypothetical protein